MTVEAMATVQPLALRFPCNTVSPFNLQLFFLSFLIPMTETTDPSLVHENNLQSLTEPSLPMPLSNVIWLMIFTWLLVGILLICIVVWCVCIITMCVCCYSLCQEIPISCRSTNARIITIEPIPVTIGDDILTFNNV